MKSIGLAIVLATASVLAACAAPIPPPFSDPPNEATPAASVNHPSQAESTAAEYEGQSGSTGSSTR